MILIAVVALIFIGPKQLPEVARNIARFINELRRSSEALKGNLTDTVFDEEIKKPIAELKDKIKKDNS